MEVKKKFLIIILSIILLASFLVIGYIEYIFKGLPVITTLTDYKPKLTTRIYSSEGEIIGELYVERRYPLEKDLPDYVKKAFVAAEDANFFKHHGISISGIIRAFIKNLLAGEVVQGGSTITQQVTRSIILSSERTFTRKIREIILSYRLEKFLTKDDILKLYLNQIYLGNNSFGIESASETYFQKPAKKLTLAEAAFLAGMPKAPSRYNPFVNPQQLKERQKYVLSRMVDEGFISREDAEKAYREPVTFKRYKNPQKITHYFIDAVKSFLSKKFNDEILSTEGLKIYTTLNSRFQQYAVEALRKGLEELDRRQGFRGPIKHMKEEEINDFVKSLNSELIINVDNVTISLTPEGRPTASPLEVKEFRKGNIYTAVVTGVDNKGKSVNVITAGGEGKISFTDLEWAHNPDPAVDGTWIKLTEPGNVFKPGDVIKVKFIDSTREGLLFSLEQAPISEGAILSLEGCRVRSMVGGYDYARSQFNRALQARRQPGSAIKPILYASAIAKGYTASSSLLDAPITFEDSNDWKPHNYEETFSGPIIFRNALIVSKNNPTVRLLWDIGIDYFVEYMKRLGIEEPEEKNLSLALGSLSISLKDLVRTYNVFAREGVICPDIIIVERVEDWKGRLVYDYTLDDSFSESPQVISPQEAYIITHLLEGVVEEGTGWRAKALNRPSAGKTGTTDDFRDAWYIGYTPDLITGVWVGNDDFTTLGKGESGARAASPIWVDFMLRALEHYPARDFNVPEGIVFAKIDAETGLLATDSTTKTVFEAYIEGTEPKEYSVEHSGDLYLK